MIHYYSLTNPLKSGLTILYFLFCTVFMSCQSTESQKESSEASETSEAKAQTYQEGNDYQLFERVRMLDKVGFTQPAEAYSLLLPKGWHFKGDIIWNNPGSACQGTFYWMKAESVDGKYSLEMFPDLINSWNSNPELMNFYRNNGNSSPQCAIAEPFDAQQYLQTVFAPQDLGNPEIVKMDPNSEVVAQMRQANEKTRNELMQYGAGQMQFAQTAVNAQVRWPNGTNGLITLGVNGLETLIPNVYNGAYDKSYTTQVTKRVVFKYPESEQEKAEKQFVMIMSSFRTNPYWNESVNNFWKAARQRSHTVHLGKIKMMDAQTKAIGEAAVRNGQARLDAMDSEMRSWEQRQSSQDRMHTNFVKTIREVENYQDETGKVELSSGYNHAWSRSDGSNFILSDNPNFDPSSVFQDQRWKEMKKVD